MAVLDGAIKEDDLGSRRVHRGPTWLPQRELLLDVLTQWMTLTSSRITVCSRHPVLAQPEQYIPSRIYPSKG